MPAITTQALRTYAIAVRDGADLFLFMGLARAPQGDLYVNVLHNRTGAGWEQWKPHFSYHASGQLHHKSFGRKGLIFHRQPPDANFRGTENVAGMGLPADEPRRLNTPCVVTDFDEVFEIPVSELRTEGRTHIEIDFIEPFTVPNGKAILPLEARIIRQDIFKDTVPWVLARASGYLQMPQPRNQWGGDGRVAARRVEFRPLFGGGILRITPSETGKLMLADRLPGTLPPLARADAPGIR
jgi:hypothetical protein